MLNSRRVQLLKVWWMIYWRLLVLTLLFIGKSSWGWAVIALYVALIIVYGAKRTVNIFPLFRFIAKRQIVVPLTQGAPGYTPNQSAHNVPVGSQTVLSSTSAPGRMTGWEPKALANIPIPSGFERMHGTPGYGLHSSHFSQKHIALGVAGEVNFAKILSDTGMLNKFDSYWSVSMPDERGMFPDQKFKTDVDCILVSGRHIMLVDVKMYTGGSGVYKPVPGAQNNEFALYDNKTGFMVGQVRKPTRNMAMALDRFRKHFPGYNVQAMVVFVPTDRGMAEVSKHVSWHNNIRAYSIDDAMKTLFAIPSSSKTERKVESKIVPLLNK